MVSSQLYAPAVLLQRKEPAVPFPLLGIEPLSLLENRLERKPIEKSTKLIKCSYIVMQCPQMNTEK